MSSVDDKGRPDWKGLLVCPKCRGKLSALKSDLVCRRCKLRYPVVDGIAHLVVEAAEPYGSGGGKSS